MGDLLQQERLFATSQRISHFTILERNRFQGKEATIPTSDIGAVYLRKGGSVAAPIALGIGCGFLGGIVAGLALRNTRGTAGPALIGIGSITGGAIGGALLGREAVKKTVTIKVLQPSEP